MSMSTRTPQRRAAGPAAARAAPAFPRRGRQGRRGRGNQRTRHSGAVDLPRRPWRDALIQAAVAAVSGSVALLGDTLHNAADALTAVPLGVAFILGRRPPTRRDTYGYGRAEDLAGIAIVLTIAASSALAAYAAIS